MNIKKNGHEYRGIRTILRLSDSDEREEEEWQGIGVERERGHEDDDTSIEEDRAWKTIEN